MDSVVSKFHTIPSCVCVCVYALLRDQDAQSHVRVNDSRLSVMTVMESNLKL